MRKKLKRKTKNRYRLARVQVPFMCLLWNKWKKKTKNRYRLAGYRGLIVEPILLQLVTLSGYAWPCSLRLQLFNSQLLFLNLAWLPLPFFSSLKTRRYIPRTYAIAYLFWLLFTVLQSDKRSDVSAISIFHFWRRQMQKPLGSSTKPSFCTAIIYLHLLNELQNS